MVSGAGRLDPAGAARPAANPGNARGWSVALASAYCLAFGPSAILVTGFGAFSGPLARAFGASPAAIAAAVPLLAIMIMLVSPLQGWLVDRVGALRLVRLSIPLFIAGLCAMALMPAGIGWFYAAIMLVPLLAVGIWPGSYMKLTGGWFGRHLGLALGTANAGIGLGAMLVTPIASAVIAADGWRAGYLVLAGLAATTLPVAALVLRAAPATTATGNGKAAMAAIDWQDRTFRLLLAGYFLIGITGTGLLTNLVPMMVANGIAPPSAVLGMGVFGVASFLGRFISGAMLDRLPARRVIAGFTLVSALGLAAFALRAPAPVLLVAVVAFGLLSGAEFDVLAYCTKRYFPGERFGRIYGLAFSAFQLGAALGAAALSLSLAHGGEYGPALLAIAATQIAAIAVLLRLGPYVFPPTAAPG